MEAVAKRPGTVKNRTAARDGLKERHELRRHRQSKLTTGTTLRGHGHVNVLIPATARKAGWALPRGVSVEFSPRVERGRSRPAPEPALPTTHFAPGCR